MDRYERERGWREDDHRYSRRDRDDEGMLERIKNDVKQWFSDDDDYEGAGYGTSTRYGGSRGSRRRDWDEDADRFRNTGSRSRYGRHIGQSDYGTGGYGDSTFGGYRRSGRDDDRSYGRQYGSQYGDRSGSRFGRDDDRDFGRGDDRWSGRSSGQDYGRSQSRGYDDDSRYGDDNEYRQRLSQGSSGRRTPVVLYSEYWVTPGPHAGVGPKGYEKSPETLKERVCERLEGHGELDASDVEVKCENEEVTLTGTVRSRRQKRLAEDCAEDVYGVQDVHNRLTVNRQYEGQYESSTGELGTSSGQSAGSSESRGSSSRSSSSH